MFVFLFKLAPAVLWHATKEFIEKSSVNRHSLDSDVCFRLKWDDSRGEFIFLLSENIAYGKYYNRVYVNTIIPKLYFRLSFNSANKPLSQNCTSFRKNRPMNYVRVQQCYESRMQSHLFIFYYTFNRSCYSCLYY